ncbi:hypothetical protein [Pedobacter metabolipauper]|uniref:Uncharacterized protein n=1 Tax=Pedobacter metabolipauper TaxID=425513 RepID=A0A4R6T158_9SPHI|nr:hypothetical protein [Pedobacter metabolipauper]TDQ11789.1 hypothetical protein ATK78_0917 [Pedobacter metabolipauper]
MKHPYKSQLLLNLKAHYRDPSWRTVTFFDSSRDEILFIVPDGENIKTVFKNLFNILDGLPEIEHPSERVVISFCYKNGEGYCSELINPNNQDEINLALIGYRPERRIRLEEIQDYPIV